MGTVQWTDNLSVGVDLIDEQHKMLIQRLNDVHAAVAAHQGQQAIANALQFLDEYARFHFDAEEKHMADCNYPGLQHQAAEHESFKTTLAGLEEDFKEDGATHDLAQRIDDLLVNWLMEHIQGVDLKFANYLRTNDIALYA